MKISKTLGASILALCLVMPVTASSADVAELGQPIVELMPQVKKMRADLQLTKAQSDKLDAWLADAPAKREALEAETLEIRDQLREAILTGADRMTREALKKEFAAKQTRLIEMRSLCTRMLRDTLTPEQFDKVVASYRASL